MISLGKNESASLIREISNNWETGISDIFEISDIDLIPSINLRNCFCNSLDLNILFGMKNKNREDF